MTVFFMCSIKSPQCNRIAKKIVDSNFPSQCFDVLYHKLEISHPVGYKTMRPKQVTGNDCDVISGFEVSGKTDFCTFIPFLGGFITSITGRK